MHGATSGMSSKGVAPSPPRPWALARLLGRRPLFAPRPEKGEQGAVGTLRTASSARVRSWSAKDSFHCGASVSTWTGQEPRKRRKIERKKKKKRAGPRSPVWWAGRSTEAAWPLLPPLYHPRNTPTPEVLCMETLPNSRALSLARLSWPRLCLPRLCVRCGGGWGWPSL